MRGGLGRLQSLSRLQLVEEVSGFGRLRCGGEDRLLVSFEYLEPVIDVLRVIRAKFGADADIGAEEGRSQLCDLS